jgi:hypothetical protein
MGKLSLSSRGEFVPLADHLIQDPVCVCAEVLGLALALAFYFEGEKCRCHCEV